MTIKVAIVDDQDMIRVGLRTILEAQPGLEVVAEAGDGLSAVRLIDTGEIDVILMDIRMPGIDGVEAIRRIRAAHGSEAPRIIILTTFDQDEYVLSGLRAGANGFLSKGVSPTDLADAIRDVVAGGGALSAAATATLIGSFTDQLIVPTDPKMVDLFGQLTAREREIVEAIVAGGGYNEIAKELFLSPHTVKTHANRAMTKVGAHDRAQLVSYAYRAGFGTR
ncbi:two component transcriptional regulator, LuxR family [Tessaracoccus bendigoensis DSM 12906]|uniref:Two component transcriptional regulator, LuxR family n=1 Tax=Tessaracoccus bendigoensis DSM 12906 TaxID=1123357 RepID=A0A1M6G2C6_9ACTN|nr:response regulator transcription factor [Tessaracoccus bendigoensis]SHJ04115.1 two component transcriptional regulator, LuxR family [Tessaracoccus bendigoensis DSM 12906]